MYGSLGEGKKNQKFSHHRIFAPAMTTNVEKPVAQCDSERRLELVWGMYMVQAFSKGDQVKLRLKDKFVSGEVLSSAVSGLGEVIYFVKTESGPSSWFPTSQCFFGKNQPVIIKTDAIPYVSGRVTDHEVGASGYVEYNVALSSSPHGGESQAFDLDAVFRTEEMGE
jgi:hypothetical protein